MASFLGRLFKYQPTKGRSPNEDFFTEAFAGVLEACPPVGLAFAEWLSERDDLKRMRVATQHQVDVRSRLDMWIEAFDSRGGRHLVVLENKLGAPEGQGQLRRYEGYLTGQPADSRTLVYVTMHGRSAFEPSNGAVSFKPKHWFNVYDWLEKWLDKWTGDRESVLVRELLNLMGEWGMELKLGAHDLAIAAAYKARIQQGLLQILDLVWGACKEEMRSGSQWHYDRDMVRYQSAQIGDRNAYYYFGFDFEREDDDWKVSKLQLPSAFFAVRGADVEKYDWSGMSEWIEPPELWRWSDGGRVRQLRSVEMRGVGLHQDYLDFFLSSLEEVRKAMRV